MLFSRLWLLGLLVAVLVSPSQGSPEARADHDLEVVPETIDRGPEPAALPRDLEEAEAATLRVELPRVRLQVAPRTRGRYYTFEHLRDGYLSGVDHRLLAPRNGQPLLQSRHVQFNNACGPFSLAMAIEYLGFAHFAAGAHFDSRILSGASLDVGYFGSPEHLIADYVAWDLRTLGRLPHLDALLGPGTGTRCDWYFQEGSNSDTVPAAYRGIDPVPRYGLCTAAGARFPSWLNAISMGWGSDPAVGMRGYLASRSLAGCGDAVGLNARTASIDDMRRVIKGFIDNGVPLLTSSRNGQHFLVVVGYAELDGRALPRALVASNPVLTRDAGYSNTPQGNQPGPRPKFWVFRDLDRRETWTDGWSSLTAFFSHVGGVIAWNHHLGGGCEPEGWAARLDELLDEPGLLCGDPTASGGGCLAPWFGYEVVCAKKDGSVHRRYHGAAEQGFVNEARSTACDDVFVSFSDGTPRRVVAADITRHGYDSRAARWGPLTSWPADRIRAADHLAGTISTVRWSDSWPSGFWWTVEGLAQRWTARRVTIRLDFDDGSSKTIEVSPPGTYGVKVRCLHSGRARAEVVAEAAQVVGSGRWALIEPLQSECDSVELEVRLGVGIEVDSASLASFRRSGNRPWVEERRTAADRIGRAAGGLSGATYEILWEQGWRNGQRWVFAGGPGSTQRRLELELVMVDGSRQVIALHPRLP